MAIDIHAILNKPVVTKEVREGVLAYIAELEQAYQANDQQHREALMAQANDQMKALRQDADRTIKEREQAAMVAIQRATIAEQLLDRETKLRQGYEQIAKTYAQGSPEPEEVRKALRRVELEARIAAAQNELDQLGQF